MSDVECPECLKKEWLEELYNGKITQEEFNRRMRELRIRREMKNGTQPLATSF